MTQDELRAAMVEALDKRKYPYRPFDLEEFVGYWWHRYRRERRPVPTIKTMVSKFRVYVRKLLSERDRAELDTGRSKYQKGYYDEIP